MAQKSNRRTKRISEEDELESAYRHIFGCTVLLYIKIVGTDIPATDRAFRLQKRDAAVCRIVDLGLPNANEIKSSNGGTDY